MKIIVEVSEHELDEMCCKNAEDFKYALLRQLDDAVMPSGYQHVELVGYNVKVIVK